MGEYDPVFGSGDKDGAEDLELVRERFESASRPFLATPWTWFGWALLLPLAAALTRVFAARLEPLDVLLLWSVTILVGGLVEGAFLLRQGRRAAASSLARWVLTIQGNLSLVAVALSAVAVWADRAEWLAGIWLLLLGHSFFVVGGLSFGPMRTTGVIFQIAGALALLPQADPLVLLGTGAGLGSAWMALGIWRAQRASG